MVKNKSTWKAVERNIANMRGGERIPVTGRQRGSTPDITWPSNIWSFEIKHRDKLPAWIEDAMNQAEASVVENQFPVCVLHPKGGKHDNDYVVMRLSTLARVDEMISIMKDFIA